MENRVTVIKKSRPPRSYMVDNEYLLYYLSDKGMLHLLRGVGKNKNNQRIWFFDRVPDVKNAIDKFREKEKVVESYLLLSLG